MTGLRLVLFANPKHSKRNAECVREWAAEEKITAARLRGYAAELAAKGFLAKADAAALGGSE